jgi:hypothetical protein
MTAPDNYLWKINRITGVLAVLLGLLYLLTSMSPAVSSALVEALHRAPENEHFDIAYHDFFTIFGFTGFILILFGTIASICATIAIRRSTKKENS